MIADQTTLLRFGSLLLRLASAGLGAVLLLALARLPGWFPVATLTLTILAACRPLDGLLVAAALVPLGGAAAALLQFPTPLSETISFIALIAGALFRTAIFPFRTIGRIRGLALLLAVTVCGSVLFVQLAVRRATVGPESVLAGDGAPAHWRVSGLLDCRRIP